MPRPRATDPSSRQSPRDPPNFRTSNTDSDPLLHHLSRTDKSSLRQTEGRSPRGIQSRPSDQRKLGTRIADLESQLGLAQEELKSLKDQLVKTVHEKKPKRQNKADDDEVFEQIHKQESNSDVRAETDVFEVTVEKSSVESKSEIDFSVTSESEIPLEPEKTLCEDDLEKNNDEIDSLRSNLDQREKQLEALQIENEGLKTQLEETSLNLSSAESEIDELKSKLSKLHQELETRESSLVQINDKLQATEKAKLELEDEMKKLRVQTEQWKKAANAAASVVISERCGSIDKRYYCEPFNGDYDYVGSPHEIIDEADDDEYGHGKKKGGSGIKMFGELWKKKVMK